MSLSTQPPEHGRAHPGPMRHPSCLCGARGVVDERSTSYFCPVSGVWLEAPCSDPTCHYCVGRPAIAVIHAVDSIPDSEPLRPREG